MRWHPLTTDFGGHGDRVTPVPIPNTEVKPVSADGTWGLTPWESRTPPDFARRAPPAGGALRRSGPPSMTRCPRPVDVPGRPGGPMARQGRAGRQPPEDRPWPVSAGGREGPGRRRGRSRGRAVSTGRRRSDRAPADRRRAAGGRGQRHAAAATAARPERRAGEDRRPDPRHVDRRGRAARRGGRRGESGQGTASAAPPPAPASAAETSAQIASGPATHAGRRRSRTASARPRRRSTASGSTTPGASPSSIVREVPNVAAVHEVIGLAAYRTGRWKQAAAELELAQALHPSLELLPVLADAYRALRRWADVERIWADVRAASPSPGGARRGAHRRRRRAGRPG